MKSRYKAHHVSFPKKKRIQRRPTICRPALPRDSRSYFAEPRAASRAEVGGGAAAVEGHRIRVLEHTQLPFSLLLQVCPSAEEGREKSFFVNIKLIKSISKFVCVHCICWYTDGKTIFFYNLYLIVSDREKSNWVLGLELSRVRLP